jgi:hypothetical protein
LYTRYILLPIGDLVKITHGCIDARIAPNGTLTTYLLDTATPLTMVLSETSSGVTTRYWHCSLRVMGQMQITLRMMGWDRSDSRVDSTGSDQLAQTFRASALYNPFVHETDCFCDLALTNSG